MLYYFANILNALFFSNKKLTLDIDSQARRSLRIELVRSCASVRSLVNALNVQNRVRPAGRSGNEGATAEELVRGRDPGRRGRAGQDQV